MTTRQVRLSVGPGRDTTTRRQWVALEVASMDFRPLLRVELTHEEFGALFGGHHGVQCEASVADWAGKSEPVTTAALEATE
jgi:hypothetical protein